MINRKVLYFYEYASEIRGKCLGHARILVCGHLLKLTLAFSLPEWEKKPCELYFIAENSQGKVAVVELGEIMPCAIMTVYNIDMEESKLGGICIGEITHVCLFVKDSDNRYIKAVTGIFDITNKSLDMFLREQAGKEISEESAKDESKNSNKEENTHPEEVLEKNIQDINNKIENVHIIEKKANVEERREAEELSYEQHTESIRSQIERLMSTRPEYRPFNAGGISFSVRIGIGDVMKLSELEPGLRENSFLLHGFYRYKHILLASGMSRGQVNYYVLVPGIKIEREQRIADMYGFHEFLTLDGQVPRVGGFGYYSWLIVSR